MPRAPRLAYGLAERLLQSHQGAAALSNSAHRVTSPVPRDAKAQAPAVTSQPESYRCRRHVCSFVRLSPLLPTAWRLASRSARREPSRTVGGDFVQANHLRPRTKHPRRRHSVARPEALVPLREAKSAPWRSARRVQDGTIPPLLGGWDAPPTERSKGRSSPTPPSGDGRGACSL